MSGDENAKTTLEIGGAEDRARARGSEAKSGAEESADTSAASEGSPVDEAGPPGDEEVLPLDAQSDGAFELSGADSPGFQLNEDSGGFKIQTDSARPAGAGIPASGGLNAAELSVVRRLEADSVLGASSLDSLDWDLGDEYEAPSGFDHVMKSSPPKPELPPRAAHGDSLPSTSALFGSDYRGDPDEESANARAQLFAGDSQSSLDYELPEVEPLDLSGEVSPAPDSADDGGEEVTADVPALAADAEADEEAEGQAEEREPSVSSEAGDDESVALESSEEEDGTPDLETDPDGFEPKESAAEDSFERVSVPKPVLRAEPRPITPFAHRSARLPQDAPSSGGGIEPATIGTLTPRSQETPVVGTRFSADTPIITSPVAAARRPTPEGTPYLRRPPKPEPNLGGVLLRVVLAGFLLIGLIASALTYFR